MNDLVVLSIIISAFWAIVVRLEVPEIDSGALSVIFPVVAVAERFPPTVDAAKCNWASCHELSGSPDSAEARGFGCGDN